MKIIQGSTKRDKTTRTLFYCEEYCYELFPFFGNIPDFLEFTPYSNGCCDSRDHMFLVTRNQDWPIVELDDKGNYVRHFGQGLFRYLHDIQITSHDTLLCVDSAVHIVREINKKGEVVRDLGNYGVPSDSGYEPDKWRKLKKLGKWVNVDIQFDSYWAFAEGIKTIKRAAPPFNSPTDISIGPTGDLFVSDGYHNAAVHRFNKEGKLLKTWGGPGDEPGKFLVAHAIWVDKFNRPWIADREGNSVQVFSENGELLAYMSDGLMQPSDLWGDDRFVYVGERGGGITAISMNFEVEFQLGFYCSPLRVHGICGNSKGELFIFPLHSYYDLYLMKLVRR